MANIIGLPRSSRNTFFYRVVIYCIYHIYLCDMLLYQSIRHHFLALLPINVTKLVMLLETYTLGQAATCLSVLTVFIYCFTDFLDTVLPTPYLVCQPISSILANPMLISSLAFFIHVLPITVGLSATFYHTWA